jgi:hypothetical protein
MNVECCLLLLDQRLILILTIKNGNILTRWEYEYITIPY